MPDLSIPNLPVATLPLTGNEITVVSQAGVASSVLISDLPQPSPELTADELDAIQGANTPDSTNVFATINDLPVAVATVTGSNVDNTDPLNPIINIPTMGDTYAEGNIINNYDFLVRAVIRSISITRDSSFAGDDTIAFGKGALNNNATDSVIGIGSDAAGENTGQKVNAIGLGAAYDNNGNNVNAIGYLAGYGNQSSSVIAIGESAGRKNSGAFCTFIGINAGYDSVGDVGNSLASKFVIANNHMPSYADRTAATTAITVLLGAVAGNTYLYYNQTTFAIEGVRL